MPNIAHTNSAARNEKAAVHTPGPWRSVVTDEEGFAPVIDVVAGNGVTVSRNLRRQDSALIAAAPDLLTALKTLAEWSEALAWRQNDDLVNEMVRAAIAKAEGQ